MKITTLAVALFSYSMTVMQAHATDPIELGLGGVRVDVDPGSPGFSVNPLKNKINSGNGISGIRLVSRRQQGDEVVAGPKISGIGVVGQGQFRFDDNYDGRLFGGLEANATDDDGTFLTRALSINGGGDGFTFNEQVALSVVFDQDAAANTFVHVVPTYNHFDWLPAVNVEARPNANLTSVKSGAFGVHFQIKNNTGRSMHGLRVRPTQPHLEDAPKIKYLHRGIGPASIADDNRDGKIAATENDVDNDPPNSEIWVQFGQNSLQNDAESNVFIEYSTPDFDDFQFSLTPMAISSTFGRALDIVGPVVQERSDVVDVNRTAFELEPGSLGATMLLTNSLSVPIRDFEISLLDGSLIESLISETDSVGSIVHPGSSQASYTFGQPVMPGQQFDISFELMSRTSSTVFGELIFVPEPTLAGYPVILLGLGLSLARSRKTRGRK